MNSAITTYVKVSAVVSAVQAFDPSHFEGAKGASQDDLAHLSKLLGGPLPLGYLEFLACLGRSSGNVCIDERFDFSLSAMVDVLESLDVPPVPLFPVAFNASGDGDDLLCLDLGDAHKYDDPGLYSASRPDEERNPDCHWADSFSSFMAHRLVDNSVIVCSKYAARISPVLTSSFYSWARTVDVDACVCGMLVRMGFRLLFPGCRVYVSDQKVVSYDRSPGRRSFVIRTGSASHSLSRRIHDELSRLMGVEVVVESL